MQITIVLEEGDELSKLIKKQLLGNKELTQTVAAHQQQAERQKPGPKPKAKSIGELVRAVKAKKKAKAKKSNAGYLPAKYPNNPIQVYVNEYITTTPVGGQFSSRKLSDELVKQFPDRSRTVLESAMYPSIRLEMDKTRRVAKLAMGSYKRIQ